MKDTVAVSRIESHFPEPTRRGFYGYVLKRGFDLLLVALVAPFVLPVLAFLWLIIRLDGGPALYCQERVGQNGRTFSILKLRTMVYDSETALDDYLARNPAAAAEWKEKQKLRDDPRVTRFGRILRKTGLDEVPQLLNVLRGDMSFVGPRPFMVEQEGEYLAAGGGTYYYLKPGITGRWQVSGRNETSFRDRVLFDNQYYDTLSFSEDLRLLAKTVPAVLRGTGC